MRLTLISLDLCFRRACTGEKTNLKLYFHEMQLQVIWSTKENQVFALEENVVFVKVSGGYTVYGGQHTFSGFMCDSDEIAV